jgi:hypothetical protein
MSRRNLTEELEQREFEHLSEKNKIIAMIENEEKKVNIVPLLKYHPEETILNKYDDRDVETANKEESDFSSSRYCYYRTYIHYLIVV